MRLLASIVSLVAYQMSFQAYAGEPPSVVANTDVCLAAHAIHELAPNERAKLAESCRSGNNPLKGSTAAFEIARTAQTLGTWRSIVAVRVAAYAAQYAREPSSETEDANVMQGVQSALSCKWLESTIDDAQAMFAAAPDPWKTVGTAPTLSTTQESCGRQLSSKWALYTIIGPVDKLEAWYIHEEVTRAAIVIKHETKKGTSAHVVVAPRGSLLLTSTTQVGLDVPWTHNVRLDQSLVRPAKSGECLIIEFSAMSGDGGWWAIVDGQPVNIPKLDGAGDGATQVHRRLIRTPLDVKHDVVMLHSNHDDVWSSSLTTDTTRRGECRVMSFDFRSVALTGQAMVKKRVGLANVSVGDTCEQLGVLPQHVRGYLATQPRADIAEFIEIDMWAEIAESFHQLTDRLDSAGDPASVKPGDLEDREQLAIVSEELLKQGVSLLFHLDIRCQDDNAIVTAHTVDLAKITMAPRGIAVTLDLNDLMKSRSITVSRRRIRDGLETVIGGLIGGGSVRFDQTPGARSGTIRVSADRGNVEGMAEEYPSDLTIEVYAAVQNKRSRVSCESIAEVSALESGTAAFGATSSTSVVNAASGPIASRYASFQESGEPILKKRGNAKALAWLLEMQIDGLDGGTYIAFAKYRNQIAAVCFERSPVEMQPFMMIGGWSGWRGRSGGARHDQYSSVHVALGVRTLLLSYMHAGALIGYEYTDFRTDVPPNWDAIGVDTAPSGRVSLEWKRHGVLLGYVIGATVPLQKRCSGVRTAPECPARLSAFFADLWFVGNLGFVDLRKIPDAVLAVPAYRTQLFEPDFDLSLRVGVRWFPGVGVFVGLNLNDIAGIRTRSRTSFNNDTMVRGVVGAEITWGGVRSKWRSK